MVLKFGGSSVADLSRVRSVARRIAEYRDAGDRVAVVVSAMAGETDRLLALARSVQPTPDERELDALLATAEQVATALLCMGLRTLGEAAQSLTGWQAGVETDDRHGRARITWLDADRVREIMDRGGTPVLAGFQGVSPVGDITTLGRGGSDTTAVALAVALGADECIISKDVDGVYSADPRIVPGARRLDRIGVEEMMELAGLGSKVLQTRSVAFAGRYGVPVRVVSSFQGGEGTLITDEGSKVEASRIAGIAMSADEALVRLRFRDGEPETVWRVLEGLARGGIEIDMVSQQFPSGEKLDLSFAVHGSDYERCLACLRAVGDEAGIHSVDEKRGLAKISVVGVGVRRAHARVSARLYRTLSGAGIAVLAVAATETRLSVAVDGRCGEAAVRALHRTFGLDEVGEAEAAE